MTSDRSCQIVIRSEVRSAINLLSTSTNVTQITPTLQRLVILLPHQVPANETTWLPTSLLLSKAQEEFERSHYVRFLGFLVERFSLDWCRILSKADWVTCVDIFFLEGFPLDAFILLCHSLSESKPSFQQDKCVSLLSEMVNGHKFEKIIWQQCFVPKGHAEDVRREADWEVAITSMVSLPDRAANQLQKKLRPDLFPKPYFSVLAGDIIAVLKNTQRKLQDGVSVSIAFLSLLIGRICQNGQTDILLDVILPSLVQLTEDSLLWRRMCEEMFIHVPDRCLEKLVIGLVKKTPWFGFLGNMLGDAVTKSNTLQFLLTKKLLLLRHYQDNLVLQNIFGYLAGSEKRRNLIPKTLKQLLETWSDGSSIKHTSYDQHMYISKAILVALGHLTEEQVNSNKQDYLMILAEGMQHHLQSPIPNIHHLGMIVAETLTKHLEPNGHQLKFECEVDQETETIKALVHPPKRPSKDTIEQLLPGQIPVAAHTNQIAATALTHDQQEIDSDDDLEPYDMSCDVPMKTVKTPVYIRDCMKGLISHDKPDVFEASLEVACKLVSGAPDFKEVCVEFMKIMLHMEDRFSTTNFPHLRHSAMVTAVVQAPLLAAGVLTEEFYDRNYNIKQRLDMLLVLADASQELSKPTGGKKTRTTKQPLIDKGYATGDNWKEIIQKRIESKTRRFGKGPSKPQDQPTPNRFSDIAGHFFFPLLRKYDSSMNTMDMLGDAFLLLGRLLFTLGIIISSAENAPVLRQMCKSMLELIWVLRYHTESFVRRGLLFCLSMVLLTVPSYMLVAQMQEELMECRHWLRDVLCKDPDMENRKLAAKAADLLDHNIDKELVNKR